MMNFALGNSLSLPSIPSSSKPFFISRNAKQCGFIRLSKVYASKADESRPSEPLHYENSSYTSLTPKAASSNIHLSFSSGLGMTAACLLGGLYAWAMKSRLEAKQDEMKAKIEEKEAALTAELQKKNYMDAALKKYNHAHVLRSHLRGANITIKRLAEELQIARQMTKEREAESNSVDRDMEELVGERDELKLKAEDKDNTIEAMTAAIALLTCELRVKQEHIAKVKLDLIKLEKAKGSGELIAHQEEVNTSRENEEKVEEVSEDEE